MSNLDYHFRDHLHALKGVKLAVLLALYLHSNVRGRCWPSHKLLCKETGYSTAPVTDAIKSLQEIGAIELVPLELRVDMECELPPHKYVYQLTGVMQVGGETVKYLYLNDNDVLETKTTMFQNLKLSESKTKISTEVLKEDTGKCLSPPGDTPHETIYEYYEQLSGAMLTKTTVDAIKGAVVEYGEAAVKAAIDSAANDGRLSIKALHTALDSPPAAADGGALFDDYLDAINEAFGVQGGRAMNLYHMLRGTARKGDYKEYAVQPGATSDEVRKFGAWYRQQHGRDISPPKSPEKIQDYMYRYRDEQAAQEQAAEERATRTYDDSPLDPLANALLEEDMVS